MAEHGGRAKNKPVHLCRTRHKMSITVGNTRIKIRYRRFRDARGKWRHELIGPFDLTDETQVP